MQAKGTNPLQLRDEEETEVARAVENPSRQ
jgi:hypothetical protein